MLGNGRYKKIVASTLCEIRGCLPLVKEGILEEAGPILTFLLRVTTNLLSVYTDYPFDHLFSQT